MRHADDDEWWDSDPLAGAIGCIMQLTDADGKRPPRIQYPRVRLGIHPAARGWIKGAKDE